MKPLRLHMQAFGPFSETETIDFTQLGENPLFLIHGQTGAGKSTILDAICFALYGKSADDVRETANLRCDRAAPGLECQVEFEFEIGDKRYRVNRKPRQLLPGRASETAAKASLVQILNDGSEVLLEERKVTEVAEHIVRITGLQVEQFRQVMVLPQGKFRELLLADSEEREKILAKLFQTQIYKQIEQELRERASEITREKSNQDEQIKGILSTAGQNTAADLNQQLIKQEPELAALEKQAKQSQESLKQAEHALQSAHQLTQQFRQYQQLVQKLTELQAQASLRQEQETQLARHQQALTVRPYIQELARNKLELQRGQELSQETERQLKQLQVQSPALKERLEQAQQAMQAKPALDVQLNQLDSLKDQFSLIQTQQTQLQQLMQTKQSSEQQIKGLSQKLEQQQVEHKAAQQAEQESWRRSQEITTLQTALKQIVEDGKKARVIQELRTQAQKLQEQASEFEQKQAKAQSHFESVKKAGLQLELAWHQGQAALLAKHLEAGEACPVCGSLEHPQLAYSEHEVLIEQHQVEHARQQTEQARQTWLNEKERWQNLLTQFKAKQEELEQALQDTVGLLSVQELATEYKRQEQALKALQQELVVLQNKAKQIEALSQSMQQIQAQQEQLRSQFTSLEREEGVMQEKLQQLQQALPADIQSQAQLLQAVQRCQEQIAQLEQALQQAQVSYTKHEQELLTCQTQIVERAQKNQDLAQVIQLKTQELDQQLAQVKFADSETCLAHILAMEQAQMLQRGLQAYKEELTASTSQQALLQEQLQGKEQPDVDALQEQFNQGQVAHQTLSQSLEEQRFSFRSLSNAAKSLAQIQSQQQALEQQYRVLGTMSDVANGKNAERITLQRFVLAVILEEVLENASQRLQYLSDGRYDLVRSQTVKAKKSGLDIDVFDVYSGQTREASTLSGGESFLASLALALGLSDVVQQRSGGIKLDTLFIDEGFGSLDQGTLELAINSLLDLRSSGRMIGIISHVSELKEQIHLGIEVKSNPTGSHIVMHGA